MATFILLSKLTDEGATDAFGHALVACGSAALMVDPDLQPWDFAAPALVVREAGGVVAMREGLGPRPGSVFVMAGAAAAVQWAERLLAETNIT